MAEISWLITQALDQLESRGVHEAYLQVGLMIPRWLGLSSLDSLQAHLDERKKDFGLRRNLGLHHQTKVIKKVVAGVDHRSWNTTLGQTEEMYTQQRKMLRG
jgi:hypothetical protein